MCHVLQFLMRPLCGSYRSSTSLSLHPRTQKAEVINPGIPWKHHTLSSTALWPLLPLEVVPQGSLFSSWRSACPSCLLGQQTKLLSFSPRVSVVTPLLHVMKFLVSSRTFFQISSCTVGTLSCSACNTHVGTCGPCLDPWTLGKEGQTAYRYFSPDFGVSYTGLQQHHLLLGKLHKSPNWSPSRLPSIP